MATPISTIAASGSHQTPIAGDWTWHPFPKDVQVSCCGNSVCPVLARAIISTNCGHLAATTQQEARNG